MEMQVNSAHRIVSCLRGTVAMGRKDDGAAQRKCCLRVPRQKHNAGRSF